MKLKQEFVLRDIAGEQLLIPIVGVNDTFNGIITLNETGSFIWKQLEAEKEKEQIVAALLAEYDVSEEQAVRNVEEFCANLEQLGIL